MKLFLLNILSFFLVLGHNFKPNTEQKDVENDLLFHSKIGLKNPNIEVSIFYLETNKNTKDLLIKLNKGTKTVFSDTLSIEMTEAEEPMIELRDINGDDTNDLVIEYLRPGRGGNNVSMVYIFDEDNLRLKKIPNSMFFPNLDYDKNLNYISSFRFNGGFAVQMDFLKIESDTLCSKYRITKEEQDVYIEKFGKGEWIKIGEETIDEDIIIPEVIALEPEVKINGYK